MADFGAEIMKERVGLGSESQDAYDIQGRVGLIDKIMQPEGTSINNSQEWLEKSLKDYPTVGPFNSHERLAGKLGVKTYKEVDGERVKLSEKEIEESLKSTHKEYSRTGTYKERSALESRISEALSGRQKIDMDKETTVYKGNKIESYAPKEIASFIKSVAGEDLYSGFDFVRAESNVKFDRSEMRSDLRATTGDSRDETIGDRKYKTYDQISKSLPEEQRLKAAAIAAFAKLSKDIEGQTAIEGMTEEPSKKQSLLSKIGQAVGVISKEDPQASTTSSITEAIKNKKLSLLTQTELEKLALERKEGISEIENRRRKEVLEGMSLAGIADISEYYPDGDTSKQIDYARAMSDIREKVKEKYFETSESGEIKFKKGSRLSKAEELAEGVTDEDKAWLRSMGSGNVDQLQEEKREKLLNIAKNRESSSTSETALVQKELDFFKGNLSLYKKNFGDLEIGESFGGFKPLDGAPENLHTLSAEEIEKMGYKDILFDRSAMLFRELREKSNKQKKESNEKIKEFELKDNGRGTGANSIALTAARQGNI